MENLEEVDDLAKLVILDESTLLNTLKTRFLKDKIYTYIGDILIAVNPYIDLPLYEPKQQDLYQGPLRSDDQPPHIYATASQLYQKLQNSKQNQCCVVSGESGSGKTESTKYIVQQITHLCHASSSNLHERIVMVNPVLEAFGNAQTILNHNSSRFGKYIQLSFDGSGLITEAYIIEYLLEKSRVVSQAFGEKNFHIFYYMLAGLPDRVLEANGLANPDQHRIVRPSNGSPVFTSEEEKDRYKEMWEEVHTLFSKIGFTETEEQEILATLAATIHLTDITFIKDEYVKDDSVLIKNEDSLISASSLLMVDKNELARALISNIKTLRATGDQLMLMKNMVQANDGRDALAKALYGRLFAWIVRKINILLKPQRRVVQGTSHIGVLDLAGFENFQNNSFEQLCINVANEQLHNFFNKHVFQAEMEEYRNEGIDGTNVKFVDNTSLLRMFTTGFFVILNDQMKMPAPTDAKFVDQISGAFKNNPNFQRPAGQSLMFVIQHYAGPVIYNANGFLEKNRDTLSDNLSECMKNSESDFICKLFYAELSQKGSMLKRIEGAPERSRTSTLMKDVSPLVGESGRSSRISMSVKASLREEKPKPRRPSVSDKYGYTIGQKFMSSLEHLVEKLKSGEPHFVRCVKPNNSKLPMIFLDDLVLQQLRYSGVLETAKIRQQGYAIRMPFETFLGRYSMLAYVKDICTPAGRCREILKRLGLKDFEIGKTKVFLRYWHQEQLDMEMNRINKDVVICQAYVRTFLARNTFKVLKTQAKEVHLLCQKIADLSAKMFDIQTLHLDVDRISPPDINDYVKTAVAQMPGLHQNIWAKLFYLEGPQLIAKVYLREWNVIINSTASRFNGRVIGLNSVDFHVENESEESAYIRRQIGAGVELMRDHEGSIMIRNLSQQPVIAKLGGQYNLCMGRELILNAGRVPNTFAMLFNAQAYKNLLKRELDKPQVDGMYPLHAATVRFAFIKDGDMDYLTPNWIFIINFAAVAMTGDEQVFEELRCLPPPMPAANVPRQKEKWRSLRWW